jgi:antitoxin ParD1/3/4
MFFFSVLAQTMGNRRILNVRGIIMPTRNVDLTDELDRFVSEKIESGRYENASEVVRAALRTLAREERQFEAKLVALRAAINKADTSGAAEG